MNIGIVTTWFERGAAYVSRQFEEVLQKDNNVFIYARGGEEYAKGDASWDKKNVYWGKRIISPFSPTTLDKHDFVSWIKKTSVEVIIFNEQHWFTPILWCKELSIKTIAYIDYYTEKTIPFFDMYDALICNTRRHYQAFSWHPGAYYVPWGTDIDIFKPSSNKISLVNKDYVTFFHSAGYNGIRKGTDILIKAFFEAKSANKLIIHTQSDLKLLYPHIKDVIDSLILQNRLEIIHKTVPAPGLYYMGDIYVYPTRLEGIGLTIAESISCGLGILISNNPPMNEFYQEGIGLLININKLYSRYDGYYWPMCEIEIKDLVNKINYLAENREIVLKMKENSRDYALKNLNYKNNFASINDIILNIKLRQLPKELLSNYTNYEKQGIRFLNDYILKYNHVYRMLSSLLKR